MTITDRNYPVAISYTPSGGWEGERRALKWALEHRKDGDLVTFWVPTKRDIESNEFLCKYAFSSEVNLVTARTTTWHAQGPVIGFYVDRDDLSLFNGRRGITALVVTAWTYSLNVWVEETGAEILLENEFPREGSLQEGYHVPEVDDFARAELEKLTSSLNLSNTIKGEYEKRKVVRCLNGLRDKGVLPHPGAAVEWAAAHGWRNKNPKVLGEYVEKLAEGRQLRC